MNDAFGLCTILRRSALLPFVSEKERTGDGAMTNRHHCAAYQFAGGLESGRLDRSGTGQPRHAKSSTLPNRQRDFALPTSVVGDTFRI